MKRIVIKRILSSDSGTLGRLSVDGVHFCRTLELPWKDNIPNISCVPTGTYSVVWGHMNKANKDRYLVQNVPERSAIFIHSGNYAGDVSKGYETHVQGCILLGQDFDLIGDQFGVTSSRATTSAFEQFLQQQPFSLTIE